MVAAPPQNMRASRWCTAEACFFEVAFGLEVWFSPGRILPNKAHQTKHWECLLRSTCSHIGKDHCSTVAIAHQKSTGNVCSTQSTPTPEGIIATQMQQQCNNSIALLLHFDTFCFVSNNFRYLSKFEIHDFSIFRSSIALPLYFVRTAILIGNLQYFR